MNLRSCKRVRIGSVGMLSSERVSSSDKFVEVRLDMANRPCGVLHVTLMPGSGAKNLR
jgi:hypothetical protein